MITIIDYGIGNLRSIEKAFERVGAEVVRTDNPDDLARADHLVLPGVGAFGACAAEIRRRELVAPIQEAVERGVPFLGVCVGMQLLFEVSEELGEHEGLGLLPGRVVRFAGAMEPATVSTGPPDEPPTQPLKVPHMGWNTLSIQQELPLLAGLPAEAYVYFVHSYHAVPDEPNDILATTPYGLDFPAIVGRGNVFGVQFHPEKSQHNGLRILENFAAF
ncbi:MAG TPA: imidazole glycerol phosphate synthase subunit HisH [Rhodothermales bacterium]|nr:imidazole glycerol phosphate synthase subunit HisH [Rhodothermales bacterium]